jgi:hypothetical protein
MKFAKIKKLVVIILDIPHFPNIFQASYKFKQDQVKLPYNATHFLFSQDTCCDTSGYHMKRREKKFEWAFT